MFKIVDKHRQGYLTKIQFKQLLKLFNIQLDDEELYHLVSEIDRNQDGLISYDELYSSLIVDALTI
jgi:Ca2+-binding EF-hand superfamily protein